MIRNIKITQINPWILALSGGLLLFFSWAPNALTFLVFFAFVPFLLMANNQRFTLLAAFGYFFVGFFVFHLLSGWWMYSSTLAGSLLAHLFNAAYMAVVFVIWRYLKEQHLFKNLQFLVLAVLWLTFEYLHQSWELAWPWFTLGHVFGAKPQWVQWYRFTGSLSGSLWVLGANFLIFRILKKKGGLNQKAQLKNISMLLLVLLAPILISICIQTRNDTAAEKLRVMMVQPNIHPQKEKFAGISASDQLDKALNIVKQNALDSIDLLLFPETMLVDAVDENHPDESALIEPLFDLARENHLMVVSGAFSKRFEKWDPSDFDALIEEQKPYVLYNSVLWIFNDSIGFIHKEKLVPLVEKQPFQALMKPLQRRIEQSGGFFGRYGTFNSNRIIEFEQKGMFYPLICFESAFPVYQPGKAKPGFIALITNDGWWKSSGGYLQHLMLARLRAVESGRWVARCANTGVSAFIDPSGQIVSHCPYAVEGALIYDIPLPDNSTVYARYGKILDALPPTTGLILMLMFLLKNEDIISICKDTIFRIKKST